ncbi:MAG: hypothetical protein U9Q67_03105, partial [Patescibacteria group bacterium]|nr:hypothetical protein [Patescibacteria group bacterium]
KLLGRISAQLRYPHLHEEKWGVIFSRNAVISYVISRILTVVLDVGTFTKQAYTTTHRPKTL